MIDILGRTAATKEATAGRMGVDVGAIWGHVADAGRQSKKKAETTMAAHPAGTLVVALGIGVVLGWVIKRLL